MYYIVVGDPGTDCKLCNITETTKYLATGDTTEDVELRELYCQFKGYDSSDNVAKYTSFTSDAKSEVLYKSNAREVLIFCLAKLSTYDAPNIVTPKQYEEITQRHAAAIREWLSWREFLKSQAEHLAGDLT